MVKRFFMAALFFTGLGCNLAINDWAGEASYTDLYQSEDFAGDSSIDARIDLKVGELQVQAGDPSKVYELDVHYNELAFKPEVDFQRFDESAKLEISLEGEGKSFRNPGKNRLDLRINPETALNLESHTGVGESNLDLTGLKVDRLVLQSGVGETRLSMLESNRTTCELIEVTSGVGQLDVIGLGNFHFKKLNFRGGVGESNLEFSGDWTEVGSVTIEVGVGAVEVRLPRDIGAELTISKGFFSNYEVEGFTKRGDTFFSDNMERVEKIVKINIRSGLGGVEVRWI